MNAPEPGPSSIIEYLVEQSIFGNLVSITSNAVEHQIPTI